MKCLLALGLLAALSRAADGEPPRRETAPLSSMSGQFLVRGLPPGSRSFAPPGLGTNQSFVELTPTLLTISSERIKQALARELGGDSSWRGRIHLALKPAQSGDDPVTIVSERFSSGWAYRIELPQFVERQRFVRAFVQVLLAESANRQAGERPAEVPAWLTEGLTQHLLSSSEIQIILPPPRLNVRGVEINPTMIEPRRYDPLQAARLSLREHPPLTLEELSWPAEEKLTGDAGEAYRRSAQLFVTELLRLKNGRECMRAMLGELAGCFNWQTAFFRAFRAHFASQLELEKWWSLQLVHFTGRDLYQLWTVAESARKLDQIVRTTVEVRRAANELPASADVTLQAIIREWDTLRQTPVLQSKVRDLELARLRIAPEFGELVEEYRRVLAGYLQRREKEILVLPVSKPFQRTLKPLVRETIRQLDLLDARRESLRPEAAPAAPALEASQPGRQ